MSYNKIHIKFRWEDPDLAEKAAEFFLADLRNKREAQQKRPPAKPAVPAATANDSQNEWHLGLDNLPEEFLPTPQFLKLLGLHRDLQTFLYEPLPDTDSGYRAAYEIVLREVLRLADHFAFRILFYLLLDSRFHAERRIRANAIGILRFGNNEAEAEDYYNAVKHLFIAMKLLDRINRDSPVLIDISGALAVLRDCGNIFFMVLGAIFPVRDISRCQMSFSSLVDAMEGASVSTEPVARFFRGAKKMYRAIEEWQTYGGTVTPDDSRRAMAKNDPAIQQICEDFHELKSTTDAAARTIANMDRRQRDLFKFIRNLVTAFVKLFRPQKTPPTPAQVLNTLQPADRYACLTRISEPHRSQIKAVIDHTEQHPIVFKQTKGNGYTLAHAVRDTWRANERKWAVVPGTFATAEDLKSACYNLREGPSDPFYYAGSAPQGMA